MPRDWCWLRARAASSVLGLAGLLAIVAPSWPATVLERTVTIHIETADRLIERTRLRVRLDSAADLGEWSAYSVHLDENRTLNSAQASVVHPDGSRTKVKRRHKDTVEYSGDNFYSSDRYQVFTLPGLKTGSIIEIEHEVESAPYYPASAIRLRGENPIQQLTVNITGGGPKLRWHIVGPSEDLDVSASDDSISIEGRELEGLSAPTAAPGGSDRVILHFSWSEDATWAGVGRWYHELAAGLPRGQGPIPALAQDVIETKSRPRQRLEDLLEYVRRQVRYVAVEIGIGGYKPTPPTEVVSRKWGDCKDKATLLLDLLDQAGIDAYPALIRSSVRQRIDVDFPTPFQFNHMIVAVPTKEIEARPDDPVGDGFLFVDPTQSKGGTQWLHPATQDQAALVVLDDGGMLAHTPTRPQHERRALKVSLSVQPDGSAKGQAELALLGWAATPLLEESEAAVIQQTAHQVFSRLLPGADLGTATSTRWTGDVPAVTLAAPVEVRSLIQGLDSGSPSFEIGGFRSLPSPSSLERRQTPAVVRARSTSVIWNVVLPEGLCAPRETEQAVENQIGRFVGRTRHGDTAGTFTVERYLEIGQRWIEADSLPGLKDLALAEYRAPKRRVRLTCG